MIGRGSFGNPWLFKEINDFFETGQYSTLPENEKYQLMFKHIEDLHHFYGEEKGYRIARKHVGWYVEQLQPESNFKRTFNTLSSTKEQLNALEDFVKSIR
ncbi:tRNA-dihydrouridine synthase B [Actinobacillus lignieresii]|nr:tRNA-dihydrouridine synthase B [Actinobacillus lignieresii]